MHPTQLLTRGRPFSTPSSVKSRHTLSSNSVRKKKENPKVEEDSDSFYKTIFPRNIKRNIGSLKLNDSGSCKLSFYKTIKKNIENRLDEDLESCRDSLYSTILRNSEEKIRNSDLNDSESCTDSFYKEESKSIIVVERFWKNKIFQNAKPFTLHCGLLFVVLIYSFAAGMIFRWLESESLEKRREQEWEAKITCVHQVSLYQYL